MSKNKVFLIIQSVLCIALFVLTALAAVRLYRAGIAYRADGHPTAWIYSRGAVGAALRPLIPLFFLTVGVTVVSAILKIRDDRQDKPVKDGGLMIVKPASPAEKKPAYIPIIRMIVLILAVVFIIAGIYNGSMQDVLYKAIKICTECIGLG